jgi:hypothetical protein
MTYETMENSKVLEKQFSLSKKSVDGNFKVFINPKMLLESDKTSD